MTRTNFKTDQTTPVFIWLPYCKKSIGSNVEPVNCFADQGCDVNPAAIQSNQSFFCCAANKIIKKSLRVDVEFQTCVMETFTLTKDYINSTYSKSQVDLFENSLPHFITQHTNSSMQIFSCWRWHITSLHFFNWAAMLRNKLTFTFWEIFH